MGILHVDLRSDAVSKPTREMLDAMCGAAVGDDVFGDDPSVQELEEYAAQLFGKEAALFCPSGIMSNQVALSLLAPPGSQFICNELSHVFYHEQGGPAYLGGASPMTVAHDRGKMSGEVVAGALEREEHAAVVVVENTVNKGGGAYYTLREMEAVSNAARRAGVSVFLDGARIFNALTESGDQPRQVGMLFDGISFCLSKGLGAPAGSVLTGSRTLISEARRRRNKFGGGMRQAGFLAAAGLYAMKNHITRLGEDHARARELGRILERRPWVKGVQPVETNILMFELNPRVKQDRFLSVLHERGILAVPFGDQIIRFTTHIGVSQIMADYVAETLEQLDDHLLKNAKS